jgi:hypothetical protein
MCSKTVARALAAVGFDALCAIHPIPWAGGLPPSPPLAGWNPAQFVGGCAVLPRISLSTSTAEIALRAFLDHPVVLYAHHEDLADGFEPLADAALRVNGLGEVRWMSLGEIAGTNYSAREADGVLAVRPYSRRLTLELHEVSGLTVEAPEPAHGRLELTGWTLGAGPVHPFGATVPLPVGARVEVRLRGPADVHPADVGAPAWTPWPLLRRMGTETRDRALPFRPGRIGRARRVVGTTRLRASVR